MMNPIPAIAEEADLVARLGQRDAAAFEALMRQHNTTLFRVARAILKNDAAAEEAVQDAYLDAFRHIGAFQGGSRLGTWLTRITINHALMTLRRQKRDRNVVAFDADRQAAVRRRRTDKIENRRRSRRCAGDSRPSSNDASTNCPSRSAPSSSCATWRSSRVEETAACLSIPPATVRTRLFRARALLREALARDIDPRHRRHLRLRRRPLRSHRRRGAHQARDAGDPAASNRSQRARGHDRSTGIPSP